MTDEVLSLLLVDDDEVDRVAVRRALKTAGFKAEITEAEDAGTAMVALEQRRFDCVLLDYRLPGTSGRELLETIARGMGEPAPVIVLTGLGDEAVAVDLMKTGAADYMTKDSVTPEKLKNSIKNAVAMDRARRAQRSAESERLRYARKLRALTEAGPRIHASLEVEAILSIASREAAQLLGAETARVELANARLPAPDRGEEIISASGAVIRLQSLLQPLGDLDRALGEQLAHSIGVALENARHYRAAQDAKRARDQLLAVVSHDLRGPLGVIQIALGLIDPRGDEATAKARDRIASSVELMDHLIRDLLDASQLEAGALQVLPQEVSLSDVIVPVRMMAEAQAEMKGVVFQVDLDRAPAKLRADRDRLMQVLNNLIGNALKFTKPSGTVSLFVEKQGENARFSVRDTGPGIPPEDLPRVFDRFWKSGSAGAGLGLFIAKGIVEAHGGTIHAASEPGRGAELFFTVPLA